MDFCRGQGSTYSYGNIFTATGPLADVNPLNYRGYVFDSETQFYYLQSRYYNPEIGRFLNADAYVSTGQGVLGNNMFAYCGNNPSSFKDDTGTFFKHIFEEAYINDSGNDVWYRPISNEAPSEFAENLNQAFYDFMSLKWLDLRDIKGAYKLKSARSNIRTGFALIYSPMPSPIDEVTGIVLLIWGSILMIRGTGEIIEEEIP